MATSDLGYVSAGELSRRLGDGRLSSQALLTATLDRIDGTDGDLHAFTFVDRAGALRAAAEADGRRAAGEALGPLDGLPVAVKDTQPVRGLPYERGSPLFRGDQATFDAPVVQRLRAAGAVIVGKTTTPEFGHIAFTHSQLGPATRNPWSRAHTCGGSSGGSAVALAAGQVPLAIGTDGGGSIRIPAGCCGVVGFKPSLGRVPYAPLVAGLDTLSHLGPMARSVSDVALFMSVLAGPHDDDWATLPADDQDFPAAAAQDVSGLRIGWAPQLGPAAPDAGVARIVHGAVQGLAAGGCEIVALDPILDSWIEPWRVIFDVMLAVVVADRYADVQRLSDRSFVETVERARHHSGLDLMQAQAQRRAVWAQMAPVFAQVDVVAMPTLLMPPLPVDPDSGVPADPNAWTDRWFDHMYPFNLTGQPAMSVPAGLTEAGLPVGVQLVGPRHADARVVRVAAAVERHRPVFQSRPETPAA